ncbi:hypothetical protein BDU57DRAFT_342720 [Ampelomyces quisqualis]|uniref:Uncharacterized protein n=1 Tax=Ampelomyces quisqualis TaxID=50730 RepID=A0A6A5QCE4_AMPQU|nr:hypothetical protein BDU57DRAFT_342720 [Ampelomyces quisqualis]
MDLGSPYTKERDGWLAMRFGCCAPKDEVEVGRDAFRALEDSQVVYNQPQIVPQPHAEPFRHPRPCTSQSMSRHLSQWVNTGRDFATRASSRASFSTLTRPRRSHFIHKGRPSISQPSNFQHLDNSFGLDGTQSMLDDAPVPIRRNRSLDRLELSIYLPNGCGRLSPLPNFDDKEVWSASEVDLDVPAKALVRVRDSRTNSFSPSPSTSDYLIQRKPVTSSSTSVSHSRCSSFQSQKSSATERRLSGTTMATMQTPTLSVWAEEPTSSAASIVEKPTIRRSRTFSTLSPGRVLSRLPSPSRGRANTAPSHPGSLRRGKTDVDEAIRELNTIVEERRASAYRSQTQTPDVLNRPPPSPSHHVPYIAPSMRMRVRSETLSDIGSAFSAPIKVDSTFYVFPSPTAPSCTTGLTLAPPSRDGTTALCSNPTMPPASHTPTKSMSRLTTWLKRSISASITSTSPATPKPYDTGPFYKCDTTTHPSTAGSHTICHTRQDSQESNTVTLFSSSPTMSSMSSLSFSPATPRKTKRVPAPLILAKEKYMQIDVAPRSGRESKPPVSPHANLLRGMEMSAKDVGMDRKSLGMPSPGAVGVAF